MSLKEELEKQFSEAMNRIRLRDKNLSRMRMSQKRNAFLQNQELVKAHHDALTVVQYVELLKDERADLVRQKIETSGGATLETATLNPIIEKR